MRIRFTTPFAVSAALRASRRWRRAPVCRARRFSYSNDAAGRRTAISRSGEAFGDLSGATDAYGYNLRSEVVSARRTKGGASVRGFDEDFSYDPIGNRVATTNYDETGSAIVSEYAANSLNQYTSRTVPGVAAVRGFALTNATVTVNENPAYRLGEYFFGSDEFDNSQSSVDAALVTAAAIASPTNGPDEVASVTSRVHIATTPQLFEYDDDGNQTLVTTKTGTWRVKYNGENRPVRWTRINAADTNDQMVVLMSFDHQGRRRSYIETSAAGSTNRLDRFTYDDYICIARNRWSPDGTSAADHFTWDPTELVATRPLVWNFSTFQPFNVSTCYYAHDGNKNVSELVSSADGSISAHYEYAPFGEVILSFGDLALTNPFRFSSEYADDALALVYYNYRHYEPAIGRWLSYDFENGDSAYVLYNFVVNDSVSFVDYLGMEKTCVTVIYAGHADWASKMLSKNKKYYPSGKLPSGSRIGFVSCFRDRTNAEAERFFPGQLVPGIPRVPGYLHKDNRPNPNNYELASKGLADAWDAAVKEVSNQCKNDCCDVVKIKMKCDKDMQRLAKWLESNHNGDAYAGNWCNREEEFKCSRK